MYALFEGREEVIDAFESKIFPIKSRHIYKAQQAKGLTILTPKQMLHMPIALAQIKTGNNNSDSLLNEIRQIVNSFYQSKEMTKLLLLNTT